MPDMEKAIEWFEHDYLPRVGAYRKDCKQGCDACMPMHDGENYCDIDMLGKVLVLLKEQEDLGTELTNAMELIHKKNERIKKLEEQIETLTK